MSQSSPSILSQRFTSANYSSRLSTTLRHSKSFAKGARSRAKELRDCLQGMEVKSATDAVSVELSTVSIPTTAEIASGTYATCATRKTKPNGNKKPCRTVLDLSSRSMLRASMMSSGKKRTKNYRCSRKICAHILTLW